MSFNRLNMFLKVNVITIDNDSMCTVSVLVPNDTWSIWDSSALKFPNILLNLKNGKKVFSLIQFLYRSDILGSSFRYLSLEPGYSRISFSYRISKNEVPKNSGMYGSKYNPQSHDRYMYFIMSSLEWHAYTLPRSRVIYRDEKDNRSPIEWNVSDCDIAFRSVSDWSHLAFRTLLLGWNG